MMRYGFALSLLLLCGCGFVSNNQTEVNQSDELVLACKNLASKYPFNLKSKQELAIADFDAYFSYAGLVDRYNQKRGNAPLSKSMMEHLKTVKTIQNVFYNKSQQTASIEIKIKTHKAPPQLQSARLFIGDSIGPTMTGPRLAFAYDWPAYAKPLVLEATLFDDSVWQKSYDGLWSLFRFIDSGQLTVIDNNKMIVSLPISDITTFEYELEGLSNWENSRQEFRCPKL